MPPPPFPSPSPRPPFKPPPLRFPPPKRFPPPPPLDTSIQWPGAVVITFTALAFISMAAEWTGPDLTFSALLAFFMAFGSWPATKSGPLGGKPIIISTAQAAAGYGNTGLLSVMFLYLMAEGLAQTGGLEIIMSYVLGRSRSTHFALVRMTIVVAFISAFLNNTPVVSIMTPILISWGRRTGVPIKKLLIPLSYAAVLGGTCTLIGTSTNLVISSQQQKRYKVGQNAQFTIFDIAPWGVPYALWGTIWIIISQTFILPGSGSKFSRSLYMALRILPSSTLPGQTIEKSPVSRIHGARIVGVGRKGAFIPSPPLTFQLDAQDVLYLSGDLNDIEYAGEELGLALVTQEAEEQLHNPEPSSEFSATGASPYTKIYRAHIKKGSDLVGRTVREADLRKRFNVNLVAIRHGKTVRPWTTLSESIIDADTVLLFDGNVDFDPKSEAVEAAFTKVQAVKDGLAKEFVIGCNVKKGPGDVSGKTLSQAGLRGIPGLHPIRIDKGATGEHISATDYTAIMEPGDTVWFAADLHSITFLNKFMGLELVQQEQVDKTSTSIIYRQFAQAAVAASGLLVGKTVRETKFRTRYNAAVVAVHREGVRIPLRVPDIVLQANDVLLLSCDPRWCDEHRHDRSFVLIKDVPDSSPPKRRGIIISVFLVVSLVITQVVGGLKNTEYIHLWPCAVLVSILMLLSGCMSGDQARRALLWDVYLTIAAAFGISVCMENTYVAKNFAQIFISIGNAIGSKGAALTAIYIATALMSEILTNNAAGAIMYPIAAIAGDSLNVTPKELSVAIMLGASAGFINPFSYQCNLMVYAAGGYTFREFAIAGAPMQFFLLIVAAFVLCYRNSWHTLWIVSWVAWAAVAFIPGIYILLPVRWTAPFEAWLGKLFRTQNFKRTYSTAASHRHHTDGSSSDDGLPVDAKSVAVAVDSKTLADSKSGYSDVTEGKVLVEKSPAEPEQGRARRRSQGTYRD